MSDRHLAAQRSPRIRQRCPRARPGRQICRLENLSLELGAPAHHCRPYLERRRRLEGRNGRPPTARVASGISEGSRHPGGCDIIHANGTRNGAPSGGSSGARCQGSIFRADKHLQGSPQAIPQIYPQLIHSSLLSRPHLRIVTTPLVAIGSEFPEHTARMDWLALYPRCGKP